MDLLALRADHDDHGPQTGLYHKCLGRWHAMVRNNFWRPLVVDRSPCARPNRNAWCPRFWICWVNGDSLLQKISPTKKGWPRGLLSFWTSWNSLVILWINLCRSLTSCWTVWQASAISSSSGWPSPFGYSSRPAPPSAWSLGPGHFPCGACVPGGLWHSGPVHTVWPP